MRHAPIIRAAVTGLIIVMAAPVGHSELGTAARLEKLDRKASTPGTATVPPSKPKPYQVGVASWYGERHHGRTTAHGETYDMFQLTAAHRTLPMGTLVRVTHLGTRRSVVVRINDRGPAPKNTIIDLSYAAARQLGMVRAGLARVRLDLVERPPQSQQAAVRLPAN